MIASTQKRKCIVSITWSLIIPVLIMAFTYYKVGIYPSGPNTVLTFDMHTQYMPFFASLRYIGHSDNSIFFNMSGALGNNFMGLAYYVFSPFAWLTVLFPLEALPTAIYVTTLIRIGLCGVTFCIYLLYTYDRIRHYLGATLLSCCYALMAYNVGYSINAMWLDAVLLLPVILLGVEQVLRDRSTSTLIISVALSMICNYYITCMSLIFVTLYTIIRLTELKRWNIKRVMRIIAGCILGMGLSMPVVLPGVLALKNGKMDESSQSLTHLFRYNIMDVLGQLFSGKYTTIFDDGLPLLFCGTATIALVSCFFISSRTEVKIKVCYGTLIVFYLVAMCFIPLDRMMHGFRETVCCEVRYSFVFSCLLLIIAYRAIDILLAIMKKFRISARLKYAGGLFILAELFMNSSILISGRMVELHYRTAVEYNMILKDKSYLLNMIDDDGFYRISDGNAYSDNDGAWLGYNGFGYFSSSYNLKLMNYLGSLGECQSYHILEDHDRTPLEESLFGAKYKISYAGWRTTDEIITSRGFYTLSKNNDALSLGYMVDYDRDNDIEPITPNAFENQNQLAKDLSGLNDNVFVQLTPTTYETIVADGNVKQVKLIVLTQIDAPVWIYISKKDGDNTELISNKQFENIIVEPKLLINGKDYGTYKGNDTGSYYALHIGDFQRDTQIEIELNDYDEYGRVYISQFDEKAYNKVISKLKHNQLILQKHDSEGFTGLINADEDGNLFVSLPFIDGWRIEIDGEKIDYGDYRGLFVIVPLSQGKHDISIRFVSPGFYVGLVIGVISLTVYIIVLLYGKMKVKQNKNSEKINEEI